MTEHLLKLADRDLCEIADAIRANRLSTPITAVGLQRLLASSVAGAVAGELQQMIDLGFTTQQLAVVLELVAKDRSQRPALEKVLDLVTTGPEACGVINRDTSVVVRELFTHAERSVLVAGYAVYQGQHVFRALADRMQEVPQLNVRMFHDVQRGPGDTSNSSEILHRFAHRFKAQHRGWSTRQVTVAGRADNASFRRTGFRWPAASCILNDTMGRGGVSLAVSRGVITVAEYDDGRMYRIDIIGRKFMEFASAERTDQGTALARVCPEVRDGKGRDSPASPISLPRRALQDR